MDKTTDTIGFNYFYSLLINQKKTPHLTKKIIRAKWLKLSQNKRNMLTKYAIALNGDPLDDNDLEGISFSDLNVVI